MAWKGPAGLLGEPATDREHYAIFPVHRHPDLTSWIHRDVFAHLEKLQPTPEGDHLFFVEGYGRLRFRILEETEG